MAAHPRTLVAIATYNEIENLPLLVNDIFRWAPDVEILVIDDGSPDGTGEWCDDYSQKDERLSCLHRPTKSGLGTATVAAMRWAIEKDYEHLLTMDADFSHAPEYVPVLIAALTDNPEIDVSIGSRYVEGGGIEGWPLHRRWMSRIINSYSRLLLRLPVRDCSGAFRCYRVAMLDRLPLNQLRSKGYSYLEEVLFILTRQGARFSEVPIVFVDRVRGETKINWREAVAAVLLILRLGLFGHRR